MSDFLTKLVESGLVYKAGKHFCVGLQGDSTVTDIVLQLEIQVEALIEEAVEDALWNYQADEDLTN